MAHALVLVEATPMQHDKLKDAMNRRRYEFNKIRKGYNIPHISEIKLYDIRAKKEVIPSLLRDLGCSNLYPKNKNINFWDVLRGRKLQKDAFLESRMTLIIQYFIQKLGRVIKLEPVELDYSHRPRPFVEGWTYAWALGTIKDIERVEGNEEL